MTTQTDQEIICKDCRNKFWFTARDQEFFAKMNFTPPVRCKPCRDKRKAEKNGAAPMPTNRPQGVAAEPIREYRSGGGNTYRNPNPPPTRDDKNDGRRRRGDNRRHRDHGDGADW